MIKYSEHFMDDYRIYADNNDLFIYCERCKYKRIIEQYLTLGMFAQIMIFFIEEHDKNTDSASCK